MDLNEPPIHFENILVLEDTRFNSGNVRIDKGAGPGIGRATATAADANNLTVLGVDSNAYCQHQVGHQKIYEYG